MIVPQLQITFERKVRRVLQAHAKIDGANILDYGRQRILMYSYQAVGDIDFHFFCNKLMPMDDSVTGIFCFPVISS